MFKNNLEAKTTIVLEHVAEIINNYLLKIDVRFHDKME